VLVLATVVDGAGTAPPEPQPQSHAGQACPVGQEGQLHTQVPVSMQPVTVLEAVPVAPGKSVLLVHVQLDGGHVSPAVQSGSLHVQVPPPDPEPAQSHSGVGHVVLAGHSTGVTQLQEPPEPPFSLWQ
jgi:hypothetical protein